MLYTARSRYSTYVVNDMDKSATPAVAFSLLVENTGTKATDVDFVFTLPFSVEPESARPEGGPVRKKRLFWRHVILKTMSLPRQARDRHRKSGEKEAFSCRTLVPRRHHRTHLRRRRQRNVSHSASHAITVVVSHLYTNAVFLPRQARDKHRESTQKRLCFLQVRRVCKLRQLDARQQRQLHAGVISAVQSLHPRRALRCQGAI